MQLEELPIAEFNRRLATSDFDTVLLEVVAGNTASRPFTFWHSRSGRNVWGYRSDAVDRALDLLRRAADENQYHAGFREFEIASLADPPAIFLALGETTRAVSKRFQVVAPPNTDILHTIADWRASGQIQATN
jgi:ABC-type transport system substrate-binding protein